MTDHWISDLSKKKGRNYLVKVFYLILTLIDFNCDMEKETFNKHVNYRLYLI